MKLPLCALLVVACVPAILAGDENPSSLWELIRDKVSHGVGPSPHVINGAEAKPHAFPHMVFLQITFRPGAGGLCGGALIHPQWVVTAAHCVNKVHEVNVWLGTHNRDKPEASRQVIKAAQIFVEKNFEAQHTDIALLKLEKLATLNEFVQTIRLPAKSMKGKEWGGTPAETTGWGGFAIPDKGVSPFLRYAPTTLLNRDDCKRKGFGDGITEFRICSHGNNNMGLCGGDSGGPLAVTEADGKKTILGVAAFVAGGCDPQFPSVFTRVDYWLDWISSLTGIPLRP